MSIELQLKELAERSGRYPVAAYKFLLQGVMAAISRRDHTRMEHVPPVELLRILLDLARDRYGAYAWYIFQEWGITDGRDFGNMVFQMAEASLLSVSSQDRIESFANAVDLQKELKAPFEVNGPFPDMPVITGTENDNIPF